MPTPLFEWIVLDNTVVLAVFERSSFFKTLIKEQFIVVYMMEKASSTPIIGLDCIIGGVSNMSNERGAMTS